MFTLTHTQMHTCTQTQHISNVRVCVCVCMHVGICVHIHACICVCMHVCVCACVRACVCVCALWLHLWWCVRWLLQDLRGVSRLKGQSTPTYCPVLTHSGHLMFGIGDMDLHSLVSPDMVSTLCYTAPPHTRLHYTTPHFTSLHRICCPVLMHSSHILSGISDVDLHSFVSPEMLSMLYYTTVCYTTL